MVTNNQWFVKYTYMRKNKELHYANFDAAAINVTAKETMGTTVIRGNIDTDFPCIHCLPTNQRVLRVMNNSFTIIHY